MHNPELRGKAFAVCGDPAKRSGIVLAKSELAKKAGVKTGDAIWEAKQKCPGLIIVSTNHGDYSKYSKIVREVYYRYTDKVEAFGGDEAWLDISGSRKLMTNDKLVMTNDCGIDFGKRIADEIRRVIREEIGLTVSVGVSWNKTYAKLGSDLKKPDATTVISRDNYRDVVFPLPVTDMLYVGRKTARLLEKLNVKTIGDLAAFDPKILEGHFGINAYKMVTMARGEDDSLVADYHYKREVKSVGNGTTLPRDLVTRREVEHVVYLLSEEVAYRMRKKGVKGYTVNLSVRDKDLAWSGAQSSIREATNSVQTITKTAMKIFDQKGIMPVRSLRVAVSNLTTDKRVQLSLLDDAREDRNDKISAAFDTIRRKHGTNSVMFGTGLGGDFKLEFEVLDN